MTAASKGSFIPIEGSPGWFEICLGGGTWATHLDGRCTCPHWEFRLSNQPGALCRHGEALAEFLDEQRQCPHCHGHGVIKLRCSYPGPDPICPVCEGTGLRQPDSLPSNAELLDLFR